MKTLLHKNIITGLIFISCFLHTSISATSLKNDSIYIPSEENLKSRTEFQNDKFGIFIHWGIYSMLAHGEWIMNSENINRNEYAKLASGFYPSKFNAHEWVSAIKASGAKYICITSRHHDGFSMFHSQHSPYNIVEATPFKRDIIKELAEECHKQNIALHFYYSHLDWYREDYYPLGNTGKGTGRTHHGKWDTYYQFMNNQLTELLTQYGTVRAIWFDGCWDKPDFDWKLSEQYALIHRLQPSCLIGNNHHHAPFAGEDLQIFERDLPGENKAGFSSGQTISQLPLETCETMNGTWGYAINDTNYKSTKDLIQYIVKAAGKNANLLMNIGPQPNGELPDMAVQRLKEIGEWMNIYGGTIYNTRGGIVKPQEWGVTTQREKHLFVHILNLTDNKLFIPLRHKVKNAVLYKDKSPVEFKKDEGGITLLLSSIPTDIDHVIEIILK